MDSLCDREIVLGYHPTDSNSAMKTHVQQHIVKHGPTHIFKVYVNAFREVPENKQEASRRIRKGFQKTYDNLEVSMKIWNQNIGENQTRHLQSNTRRQLTRQAPGTRIPS